jgi:hypothetical protein
LPHYLPFFMQGGAGAMPMNTKHLFLISPELGNQFILISILTPRRAANFRGGYLVTFACGSPGGTFGAGLAA